MPIPQVKTTKERPQGSGYMETLRVQLAAIMVRVQNGEPIEPIVEELKTIVYASYKAGKESSRGKA